MPNNFMNRYTLISKIGEGSFSEVIKVQDKQNGLYFAAKRLTKTYKTFDEVMNCNEIQTMKSLSYHPNVLGLYDIIYDSEDGDLTLIFELMDMSMYDFIKNRKRCLSESRVKNYMFQLVCGLHHLHRSGVFHRDIKPENILIKVNNNLKNNQQQSEIVQISDLGSVCSIHSNAPYSSYIATRWYRAPECLLTSGYYSSKMDIWALGCCFYEMLTLKPLFPGDNELDQLYKIHDVLGTPSSRILDKIKQKNFTCDFPKAKAIGFYNLVPILSDYGIDVLNRTLVYNPDTRISINRLMDHVYFKEMRELKQRLPKKKSTSTPSLLAEKNEMDNSYILPRKESNTTRITIKKKSNISPNMKSRYSQNQTISKNRQILKIDTKEKQLERIWGMNDCPGKAKIINKFKI